MYAQQFSVAQVWHLSNNIESVFINCHLVLYSCFLLWNLVVFLLCLHSPLCHMRLMLLGFVSVNYKVPFYFTSCLRIELLQMLSQSTEKTRALFCFGQLYLYLVSIFTCNIQWCWIYMLKHNSKVHLIALQERGFYSFLTQKQCWNFDENW